MTRASDELSTEQIISAMSHLSLPELEQVFNHLLALRAERKAPHLSASESALLLRINQGLPAELRDRIAVLRTKREDDSITGAEYDELTRLVDRAEELHAERMGALCELAKLRSVRLPVLMDQLGIHFPENA
ncbi:MAG TPA: STAS/SEC14 domain-containing protein [Blastocatellia bacterium]|nr:STAS/SEC14 domain-containing protein [Blastocatellia bacterium]